MYSMVCYTTRAKSRFNAHHTDGGGNSDHVFALCSLLAPRIPDLKSRRLYSFGKAAAYPSLEH
jgi:TnpA family transposase